MVENPNFNATTGLAHLILAGTSGWALRQIGSQHYWSLGTFSLLLGHGLIGVLYFGNPNAIKQLQTVYEATSWIAEILPIPFINADLFLAYKLNSAIAYIHALSIGGPLPFRIFTKDHIDKVIDIVLIGNIASLVFISVTKENSWSGGLAALSVLNHFVFRRISERFEVPKMDVVAIGLSFFTIFGVNALSEAVAQ